MTTSVSSVSRRSPTNMLQSSSRTSVWTFMA
jgi:hypothetical protein